MTRLSPRHWRPLLDAVYEMNTAGDHADFATAVLAALGRLVPADICHLHVIDRMNGRIMHHTRPDNPFTPDEIAYYLAHPSDNAFVAYYERTGDQRARRLSDIIDVASYRRTEFYRRCLHRLGFKHSLILPITVNPSTIAGLAFDRCHRDFAPSHCRLLDAFAPHFRLAWQRHDDPWREQPKAIPPARQRLVKLGLTAREADVLFWMTEGKQNREIAIILSRSLHTVQEHVANILRKLGQENRHAATVFALRRLNKT